jgi:hypothetical protein
MIDLVVWRAWCHKSYSDKALLRLSIDMTFGAPAHQLAFLFCRHVLAGTRVIKLLLTQMWHRPWHRAPTAFHVLLELRSWFLIIQLRFKRILPRNLLALNGSLSCIITFIVIRVLLELRKINHVLTFVWAIDFITIIRVYLIFWRWIACYYGDFREDLEELRPWVVAEVSLV